MVQQHSRFYCIQSVSTILIPQPIPHPTEIIKIVGVRCTSPDNTLYSHTIFPAFISSFPSYSEKNIYLCHTLSAHQRDETGKSVFLFLNGVNNVLSGEVQRTPTIFMISVGWGIGWGIRIVETDRIQ